MEIDLDNLVKDTLKLNSDNAAIVDILTRHFPLLKLMELMLFLSKRMFEFHIIIVPTQFLM